MNKTAYQLRHTSRQPEETEWSISYAYNTSRTSLPRVLLIGDSICNGYQNAVRERLDGRVNVSFWASSLCVTDPDYLGELEHSLLARPCQLICFNNGLHSLHSVRREWDEAYRLTVAFIRDLCPQTALSLTLNTPLRDPALTALAASLNETIRTLAAEQHLPVLDLFAAMDPLDRDTFWTDTYHFQPAAIAQQADLLAAHITSRLGLPEKSGGTESLV